MQLKKCNPALQMTGHPTSAYHTQNHLRRDMRNIDGNCFLGSS